MAVLRVKKFKIDGQVRSTFYIILSRGFYAPGREGTTRTPSFEVVLLETISKVVCQPSQVMGGGADQQKAQALVVGNICYS